MKWTFLASRLFICSERADRFFFGRPKTCQAKQNRTKAPHAARSATNPKKKTGPAARTDSKLAAVVAMLREPKGKSIDDLMKATGWQAHSVRGAISGAIKKKLGFTVTSEKADGVRVYRISA